MSRQSTVRIACGLPTGDGRFAPALSVPERFGTRQASGFTLIALLMAIIIPALNRAREMGRPGYTFQPQL